jgi:hypothetical protein
LIEKKESEHLDTKFRNENKWKMNNFFLNPSQVTTKHSSSNKTGLNKLDVN